MHNIRGRMHKRINGATGSIYTSPYTPAFTILPQGASNVLTPSTGSLSVSVAAAGTYFNNVGAMTAATLNQQRTDYQIATSNWLGTLVEQAAVNLFLNSLIDGTSLSTQSVTLSAIPYTLSFYGTGTVTLSGGSTAGPLVGTGANNRVTLTFTPSAGSTTFTVTGQVKWAQVEAGAFASSFIPTAGTSVLRAADTIAMTLPAGFNASEGTFVCEFINRQTQTTAPIVTGVDDGTNNERMQIFMSAANEPSYFVVDGGVIQVNVSTAVAVANNAISRIAFAYKLNDFAADTNGGTVVTDGAGTLPTVTTLRLGSGVGGLQYLNGWIRKIYYYPIRVSNAQLQIYTR